MTVKEKFERWWSDWSIWEGETIPEELIVSHTKNPDYGGTWKLKNLLYIAFYEGYKTRYRE
jgi:hypothetical protein